MKEATSPTCQQAIGAAIRQRRTEQGFTQDTLSDATGIGQGAVSDIERGNFEYLNLRFLHLIALATDTPPTDFLRSLDDLFNEGGAPARPRTARRRRLEQVAS